MFPTKGGVPIDSLRRNPELLSVGGITVFSDAESTDVYDGTPKVERSTLKRMIGKCGIFVGCSG